ncbi:sensor histidine kinase [Nigerium massiliense]|uniref:sensor histidine kinase n=1 Tax=Nigerium massiliense TaxID=1522317 RepID=UPI000ADE5C8F|nr:histidine kinase [Nigerium massiliense]
MDTPPAAPGRGSVLPDEDPRVPAVRPLDAVVALTYAAVGVLTYTLVRPGSSFGPDPVPVWLWLPLVLLGSVAVLNRTRWRPAALVLAVLVPVMYMLNGGVFTVLLLVELAYAVALSGRRAHRLALAAYAVVLASGTLASDLGGGAPPLVAMMSALLVLATVALGAWWGGDVRVLGAEVSRERERSRLLAAVAEVERDAAAARAELARAEQRVAMGRDLHDVVAGRLAAISLQTARLLDRDLPDEAARSLVEDAHACAVATQGEVRAMIDDLSRATSPGGTAGSPGTASREDLARVVDWADGLGTRLELSDTAGDTREAGTLRLVAQEAVANALRHAGPGRGSVRLVDTLDAATLEVVNDLADGIPLGSGRDDGSDGFGLSNMRQRVEQLGGRFAAGADGDVWRVRARIPRREGRS